MQLDPKIQHARLKARALIKAVTDAETAFAEVTACATDTDLDGYFFLSGGTEPDEGRGITKAEYLAMASSVSAVTSYIRDNWHHTNLYKGASQ